jgi:uncharacterized Tic20 family protein
MNNLKKTLIVASIVCFVVILSSTIIQLIGQSKITLACSYLDPVIIDILALSAALFLIIEGFAKIFSHSKATLLNQVTRIVRIAFGFAIVTLHVIQILHK